MNAMPAVAHDAMFRHAPAISVLGMGRALPGRPVPTADVIDMLESRFGLRARDKADAIADRLGIDTRHAVRDLLHPLEGPRPGDSNAQLCARAVSDALAEAGLRARDLGYLIGHTATPDVQIPANVAFVADLLDYPGPFAEFRQACTGFANALTMAIGLLSAPGAAPVAIVGSETGSLFVDLRRAQSDKGQLVNILQMGDCAAAIVLARADGRGDEIDRVAYGGMGLGRPASMSLRDGGGLRPVPRHGAPEFEQDFAAIRRLGLDLFRAGAQAARGFGTDLAACRSLIPHQANGRLAEMAADTLGVPAEAFATSARRIGNTGSAAIWAALFEERTRLARGEYAVALGAEATKHQFATFRFRKG